MRILILLFLGPLCFGQSFDILIKNGKIIDGTGNSWYYGDVGIKDGMISAIGKSLSGATEKTIDAKGLIVAPGFIDVHAHVEGGIMERPQAENYIYDGVTTVITGNCGSSANDLTQFFNSVNELKTSINVASLYGHNTVRKIVIGESNRKATTDEQNRMEELVKKAMVSGAVGLSTGLIYLPGMYSSTEEIVGLAKAAASMNGVYASHIRNEENEVIPAINEAIQIAKEAQIPVEISHFKVSHKANWGRSKETIPLIENARRQGYDVTIDQYPYTASSTNLGVRLPDWALSGGQDSLVTRINDPMVHKMIIAGMLEQLSSYKYTDYSFAVVANYNSDPTINGKSISAINLLKGRKHKAKQEAETILEMMKAGGAQMVYHGMDEADVQAIIKYPFNMIGADAGVPIPFKSMPHPRAYGTNARVLARYVREQKLITLEDAVRRMTSLAAQKFHLKDRGLIKEGMAADLVVFDEDKVKDKATFEKPHQYSEGFHYVIVNGRLEVEDSKYNGERNGKALMGPGYLK
ncbi:MAG: D-aminoacylase [Saprospiraceae bacterium]